ncbi:MAG: hypothetical protein WBI17_01475 [Clostridiaceae bacterium]
MKKVTFAIFLLLIIIGSGCTTRQEVQELSDLRPMIMAYDLLFLDTGKVISIDLDDSEIIGKVHSSTLQHEKPTENGQTNFGYIGSKYIQYGENIVVFINHQWILFERAE